MPDHRTRSFLFKPRKRTQIVLALATLLLAFLPIAGPAAANDKIPSGITSATNSGTPTENTEACTISFADVQPSDYYYEPVRWLYCEGAISGYPDGTFRPGNNATRGQLSKIVVVAKDWPIISPPVPSFPDVQPSNPFYPYVETARAHGVIGGYADGTFRPNSEITRGQLTKVVVLAQAWPLIVPGAPSFSDVPASSPFYPYVETAVSHGVVSGYGDDTFRPGNTATRGQISKIVYYSVTGITPPPSTPTPVPVVNQYEQQMIDLINQRRAALGVGQLRASVPLNTAARRHSNDVGPAGLCTHTGTDGTSPWDRIAQAGYAGFAMGEVVACNFNSPQAAVDAWWASPGHQAILADAAADEIGCGWWLKPDGYGWATCDTGSSD